MPSNRVFKAGNLVFATPRSTAPANMAAGGLSSGAVAVANGNAAGEAADMTRIDLLPTRTEEAHVHEMHNTHDRRRSASTVSGRRIVLRSRFKNFDSIYTMF